MYYRQVRERLYRESFEFIKQQRVGCLVAGAWFPMAKEKGRVKNLWRYYRMAPNKRWLHYKEYSEKLAIKPVLDDLVERGAFLNDLGAKVHCNLQFVNAQ